MRKHFATIGLVLVLALSAAGKIERDKITRIVQKHNDTAKIEQSKALNIGGSMGLTFDKSANGYGWYGAFNRKIQTNHDPVTGTMVGSVYRRLADTGSGTIGGMIGNWNGTSFQGFAQTAYGSSPFQGNPMTDGSPGGRFPSSSEFINGYFFGLFNDFNVSVDNTVSQPMFVVCDATFGWDESEWIAPKRIEAVESGTTIPGAWLGKGDVAYNPADGYYYWTTTWDMGGLVDYSQAKYTIAVGRSATPTDPESWEWTDYSEIILDCSDTENGFLAGYGDMQIAYAKDIYGNGTGSAIATFPFLDVTYVMTNLNGDTLDVQYQPRLGYMYTTNWGADWTTGDYKNNWQTPGNEGNNLFAADINKLFDWYNTELTDTVSVDSLGNATIATIPLNWPYILWNSDVVATEDNLVHALIKVGGGASTESDYIYYTNEEKTIAGFYDIVGEITPSGVIWKSANYVAAFMGIDDGNTEWKFSNTHKLSIGYAGYGIVYASWWDRPETRYLAPPPTLTDPDTEWIDDAFFIYSPDHGRTWAEQKIVNMPNETNPGSPYQLKYAWNVTKTNNLQDEGWTVSTHGTHTMGVMTVYAACQYYDPENLAVDPPTSYKDYQQFLKVWKITVTGTGIETESVSMIKDFSLMQNYPNPFNPSTQIKFALKNEGKVKLSVFNTKGELVANLKNEKMAKGSHAVNFNAQGLNSGVYFYKLDVNGMSETKKMILTK
jgi:hypothetical protein